MCTNPIFYTIFILFLMQYGVLKMDNQKNKVRKNIYIDKDVWDLLEYKLPCSRSSFFERKAREYLNLNNELEELKRELKEHKSIVKDMESEIERLEKLKESNNQNEKLIEQAMIPIRRAFLRLGYVEKSTVIGVANINGLDVSILEKECKNHNIKIQ